jgi:hypothetical protein
MIAEYVDRYSYDLWLCTVLVSKVREIKQAVGYETNAFPTEPPRNLQVIT